MVRKPHGFTLVELVIVIVISGILAGVVMRFITMPIDAYVDTSRRARLVDVAQNATGQIGRALQRALPNSIRTGCGGSCVEFLRVATGGRYRATPPGDLLYFLETDLDSGLAETGFDVVGPFNAAGLDDEPDDATACVEGRADCVVIYNTGLAAGDAWNRDYPAGDPPGLPWRPDNLATLTAASSAAIAFNNTHFSTDVDAFPAASPGRRFFIVDTPVTFLCSGDAMRRFDDYEITQRAEAPSEAQLQALSSPPTPVLMANRVAGCQFDYQPGTPTRNGLLTVRITVAEAGETLTLLEQIHVANLP